MLLKMSSAKWQAFCLGLNVLRQAECCAAKRVHENNHMNKRGIADISLMLVDFGAAGTPKKYFCLDQLSFGLTSVFYKENPRQHSSHRVELCFEKNPLGALTIPERLLPPLFPLPSWWPLEYKNSSGPGLTFWCHGMEMLCIIMTSSNGNIFRVTGPLCGEFTGPRWIPRTKVRDAELWYFLWSAPWINAWAKKSCGCWFETPSRSLWRHCNDSL